MLDREILIKKLEKHTLYDNATGCWLWTGSVTRGGKSEGYGRIGIEGVVYMTHRLSAYIFHDMPIDKSINSYVKDFQALHKCENKACWNPDHLQVGSHADNMTDRDGFTLSGKTYCINGHDLSDPESYYKYGKDQKQRKCKQCVKNKYNASRGR